MVIFAIFIPLHECVAQNISAEREEILSPDIGGIKQFLQIKTDDPRKPVLLFLSGGPGSSMMKGGDTFTNILKKKFTIVQWDQRDAGKTLKLNPSPVQPSVEQMQNDTYQVVDFLIKKFGQEKIFLLGSSWGNVLGFHIVKNHPELLHAYFAVNPVVSQLASEKELLQTLKIHFQDNAIASKELASVNIPFQSDDDMFYLRKWLFYKDGKEYATSDDFKKGFLEWSKHWSPVWKEVTNINLPVSLKKVDCPVYFFVGKNDIQTSTVITERYFAALQAPKKDLFLFEKSGHQIHQDEPEKFQNTIIKIFEAGIVQAKQLDSGIDARISRVEAGLLPAAAVAGKPVQPMPLSERMAALKVPGISIAVINHGAIEWARGYGLADVASGRTVNEHTRFQAGSISKSVTAMAAMSLVQAGRLSLDTDVNSQLGAWKLPDNEFTAQRKVTLRALLSHTAGVGVHGFHGYAADKPMPTLLELLDGKAPANSAPVRVENLPGSAWSYSGGGYEIVQLLVTETSRERFDLFLQHAVLDKIGMKESSFVLPAEWEAVASNAHLADGSGVPGKWHRYPEMAAASLWTTPSDLARFVIEIQKSAAGKSNKVLSQKMTNDMLAPGIEAFGLGLFLGEKTDANASFYHGGGNQGFSNMMFAYTSTGQGAIVMTNGDNGSKLIDEVLRGIAREYGWTNYVQ